ncbi:MAG: hypothetical protein SNJ56_03615, partial [Termitinemataceae bacterium]
MSYAQNLRSGTKISVLTTEHFEILFPQESRQTAYRLASFADEVYAQVTDLLDIKISSKIPVLITPHTDQFNGYMNPLPYPHIVLYDTPMDIEWTTFQDPLRSLFLHELTHAVSLNSRNNFFNFFHGMFGSWVSPTFITAPLFMVEGVTVSFESLDGFGRVNDPFVQGNLRQAVYEGRALSPFQASGVYDYKPFKRSYYEYGGLFSAYLQQRYGMDTYRKLWSQMGARMPLSLFYYRHGFANIFKKVYGKDLRDVWQDFLSTYQTTDIGTLDPRNIILSHRLLSALASEGTHVYGIDRTSNLLVKVDIQQSSSEGSDRFSVHNLRNVPASAYDISIHPQGSRILVSSYRYEGDLARAIIYEYTADTGHSTGRSWEGLYKASYFRDGLVGIASRLHHTDVVYIDSKGQRQTLFTGNEHILFSKPVPLNDRYIAIIVAIRGIRRLAILDSETSSLFLITSSLLDDDVRWQSIRSISVFENTILFSYSISGGLYTLGRVVWTPSLPSEAPNGEPTQQDSLTPPLHLDAWFLEKNVDGGIHNPVYTKRGIFYTASQSTWDSLIKYPEIEPTGIRTTCILERYKEEEPSVLEIVHPRTPTAGRINYPERKYSPIRYLNPLKFWLPVPLINPTDTSFYIDGMGILTYLMDPTETNTILITAGGNLTQKMGYFDVSWTSLALGFPAYVNFSDQVETQISSQGTLVYRASRASLSLPFSYGIGDSNFQVQLMPSIALLLAAFSPEDQSSAYTWAYERPIYSFGLGIGLSNLHRRPWQLFGNGTGFTLQGRTVRFDKIAEYRVDSTWRFTWEPPQSIFAARGTLYGAWDTKLTA